MKIQSAEIPQNNQAYENLRELRTKDQKINVNQVNKGKKYVKKEKKIFKIQKKLQSETSLDKKQNLNQIFQSKRAQNKGKYENIGQNSENFVLLNQISNSSCLYEKVSELFFADSTSSTEKTINQSKFVKNVRQKVTKSRQYYAVNDFLTKLKDQRQIKVLDLLSSNQRLLFKTNKLQDIQIYQNEAEKFSQLDRFFKHTQNHRCKQQKLQQQFTVILQSLYNSQSTFVKIKNNPLLCLSQLKGNLETISFCEQQYLRELGNFQSLWKKQICHKINEAQDLKEIAKILIVLLKCYKANNSKVKKMLEEIQKKNQIPLYQEDVPQKNRFYSSNEQFYTKCLIKKCLIKTFSQVQTLIKNQKQLWNFFKRNSHFQQSILNEGFFNNDSYVPIETEGQYKEYIKRIMNRKIMIKPILHTSCKACFSSHFQKYNPIIRCPQCKYRMHKSCGKIQDRCDRCNYKKLGTSLKQNVNKCFICLNDTNSLMLHKIKGKGNRFAHNFCLIVHNLWTVENNRFVFDHEKYSLLVSKNNVKIRNIQDQSTSTMIDQMEQTILKVKKSQQKINYKKSCKFCGKGSQFETQFLRKCQHCNEACHILCAYLNGCKIEITGWKSNFQIELQVTCCPDQTIGSIQFEQKRKRLEMSRKYKLNYQNFATNHEKQSDLLTINSTQNIQLSERKLTTANIEGQSSNMESFDPIQQDKVQEYVKVSI